MTETDCCGTTAKQCGAAGGDTQIKQSVWLYTLIIPATGC